MLSSCSATGPATAPKPTSSPGSAPVQFVEDDYARARDAAKAANKLLFVDAWAPWCHSCLSMRAFVLGDPKLAALDGRFTWLAVDTEKDENASFVAKFPNHVYPTLWVIDPKREEVVLEWPGTATADELVALLASTESPAGARLEAAFLRANREAAAGETAKAAKAYADLLAELPAGHALVPRVTEGAVSALYAGEDHAACAELAARRGPELPPGTSRATVLAMGLSCAREAKRAEDVAKLTAAVERAALDPDPRVLADDRSALFEELVETKKHAGDAEGAKRTAEAWARFLEGEAARAKTREARAVFDAHRLSAYLALGHAERALPMLEESERDFPADYNPPARLARALLELGRLEEAAAAVERAAARVYGPRALRVLVLAADIAKARKDVGAERAALETALARTQKVQLTKGQRKLRADLEARLRALKPAPASTSPAHL